MVGRTNARAAAKAPAIKLVYNDYAQIDFDGDTMKFYPDAIKSTDGDTVLLQLREPAQDFDHTWRDNYPVWMTFLYDGETYYMEATGYESNYAVIYGYVYNVVD